MFFWVFTFFITGCSSIPYSRVFSDRQLDANPYFTFFKGQKENLQLEMKKSSLAFFLTAREAQVFAENLNFHAQSYGILRELPSEVFSAWLEVAELETLAILKATHDTIKNYHAGACLNAYTQSFTAATAPDLRSVALPSGTLLKQSFTRQEEIEIFLGTECRALAYQHLQKIPTAAKNRWLTLLREHPVIRERLRFLAQNEAAQADAAYRMSFDVKSTPQ